MRIVKQKWGKLKNSKFFLGLICLVIGAAGMFCYINGKDYYDWAKVGYGYSMIVINRVSADDSLASAGGSVQTDPIPDNKAGVDYSTPLALIQKYDWDVKVTTAVFKTESGLNPTAMNWNCYYNGKSKQCKVEDRGKAWSVDCGIAQINVKGKDCPAELFNPEINIAKAYEMYQKRGFKPWVSYINDYHLANF